MFFWAIPQSSMELDGSHKIMVLLKSHHSSSTSSYASPIFSIMMGNRIFTSAVPNNVKGPVAMMLSDSIDSKGPGKGMAPGDAYQSIHQAETWEEEAKDLQQNSGAKCAKIIQNHPKSSKIQLNNLCFNLTTPWVMGPTWYSMPSWWAPPDWPTTWGCIARGSRGSNHRTRRSWFWLGCWNQRLTLDRHLERRDARRHRSQGGRNYPNN